MPALHKVAAAVALVLALPSLAAVIQRSSNGTTRILNNRDAEPPRPVADGVDCQAQANLSWLRFELQQAYPPDGADRVPCFYIYPSLRRLTLCAADDYHNPSIT
jgi:hypothetical protein